VLRDRADGSTEVLVVLRNKYDDWSLPKGKVDKGEWGKEAALLEVLEETGRRCEAHQRLRDGHYTVDGRPKRVKWWTMSVVEERGGPSDLDEVQEVRWVPVDEVASLLSYPDDVGTVNAALERR